MGGLSSCAQVLCTKFEWSVCQFVTSLKTVLQADESLHPSTPKQTTTQSQQFDPHHHQTSSVPSSHTAAPPSSSSEELRQLEEQEQRESLVAEALLKVQEGLVQGRKWLWDEAARKLGTLLSSPSAFEGEHFLQVVISWCLLLALAC